MIQKYLNYLGYLFYLSHTIGLKNMYEKPEHLTGEFINSIKEIRDNRLKRKNNDTKDMKTKKFDIGTVKIKMYPNGFPKGFCTKRDATLRECKHIMKNILGIDTHDQDCFVDRQEYKEYNHNLVIDVNKWLRGDYDDTALMADYAYDSDEPLGCMNLIPIIAYLKSKEIID